MTQRTGLTHRQKQVLDYIGDSIVARGFPPTLREIGQHMGIRSTNGVNDHLKALEKKGYLVREDLKSRALRPTSQERTFDSNASSSKVTAYDGMSMVLNDSRMMDVPLLGIVAAGPPSLAVENVEDTLRVDRQLLGQDASASHGELFALRVRGDSMIEEGILEGDVIFVRRASSAQPGDLVVALIDEEATVKRYFPESDHIRFQPANSNMQPILVASQDAKNVEILGQVVGLNRQYR